MCWCAVKKLLTHCVNENRKKRKRFRWQISRNKRKHQPIGMLGWSGGNQGWLLVNASACVSCGFRLRNARNASDCVWIETGLKFVGYFTTQSDRTIITAALVSTGLQGLEICRRALNQSHIGADWPQYRGGPVSAAIGFLGVRLTPSQASNNSLWQLWTSRWNAQ